MKLLLYCTKRIKRLGLLAKDKVKNKWRLWNGSYNAVNSKIVAECDFEVEEIISHRNEYETKTLSEFGLCDKSCLTHQQLFDYLKKRSDNETYLHNGYAIHIKNLNIFDNPKKLSDFVKSVNKMEVESINKAPQSMMYAYSKDFPNVKGYFASRQEYVLISIRPEYLCKILNGEKTIEVRKKVLKEML